MDNRYVRYVKCHALRHILVNAPELDISRLVAGKTHQEEYDTVDTGYPFIRAKRRVLLTMEMSFNSILHGAFPREGLVEVLDGLGADEVPISELDVVLPESAAKKTSKEAADLLNDPSVSHYNSWVLALRSHPLRREDQENDYPVAVRKYWDENITYPAGFEFASLDFDVVLPTPIWKEVHRTHGSLGREYQEQLEEWRQTRSNDLIRTAVREVFPRPMTSGREYTRREGERWVLTAHGDI